MWAVPRQLLHINVRLSWDANMRVGLHPRSASCAPRPGEVSVELLPVENSALVLSLPGICTATFYALPWL